MNPRLRYLTKFTASFGISLIALTVSIWSYYTISHTMSRGELNMANTVSPILSRVVADACGYLDPSYIGGQVISKREPHNSCISGTGNVYYAQCIKPEEKEVSLNAYSCIDEEDVNLPYFNLRNGFISKALEDN